MEPIAHEQFILEYQNAFRNPNFIPMVEDGLQKVKSGIIDLKELMRVVDMTDRMS